MSNKLTIICLFILAISILISILSVKSDRNDSESARHRIQKRVSGGWSTENHQDTIFRLHLNDSSTCLGTFIAPNAILTAAHCCDNFESSNLKMYNQKRRFTYVTVPKYHIHPYYKSGVTNYDIAIIITDMVEYAAWIVPATLDYSRVQCGETLYGYGLVNPLHITKETYFLNELFLEVVQCRTSWYNFFLFWLRRDEMIYTYGKNGSMCFGDSGGPVFNQNGAIVGVHSGGGNNCSTREVNFAVRISTHKRFIQTALQQNSASSTLNLNLHILYICISFYIIY